MHRKQIEYTTIGCLLYFVRALDNTLLVALNTISQLQSKLTTRTKMLCDHILNCCATKPNVELSYYASNTILSIDSDASFLVAPEAKSCIVGYFSLQLPLHTTSIHAPILFECKTLKTCYYLSSRM